MIEVDRLVERTKKCADPLLNLIESPNVEDYGSAVWDVRAYTKMFEKFSYAKPLENIKESYKDLWDFASRVLCDEYQYMLGSCLTPIICTNKNIDSTPGFPKFLVYDSESDYLKDCGNLEYIKVWDNNPNLKPLWWTFLKTETLKQKKIKENDIRMIMCTDPVYTRFGACFEEDQNVRMKGMTETHQAQVGWCPFFGGLDQRLRRLSVHPQFIEMDWTRFDGTIPSEVFRHIKEFRWCCLADEYKTEENRRRWEWYVNNLIDKIVLLPTGEVTKICGGNPSGQISTTTDNNMVNTFLTAFEVAYLYKHQFGVVPTLKWFRNNVQMICYGDDRLMSTSEILNYDPVKVIELYKDIFGMWVKPENIKVSQTLEGLSFCGFTFTKKNDKWVGIANHHKLLSSLQEPVKRLKDVESLWTKLVSLRLMCENSPHHIKEYLDKQIWRVEQFCKRAEIELPDLPASFFSILWQ
nr:MAG: RNA-dependent RNA polymerase [Astroviridae sp.]